MENTDKIMEEVIDTGKEIATRSEKGFLGMFSGVVFGLIAGVVYNDVIKPKIAEAKAKAEKRTLDHGDAGNIVNFDDPIDKKSNEPE
ncbi:MAG: hypothetical protein LBL35_01985 [Clostridiales bacterium]|jgi:hypothetical protein|nr:hypothetical protein [Clostridiales bacterium]